MYGGAGSLPTAPSTSSVGKSGAWLLPIGDVDGDGYADAALDLDVSYESTEYALVFSGGPSGLSATPTETLTIPGRGASGVQLAAAGDVDGDGYADLLVSVPNFAVHLYRGGPHGLSETPSTRLDPPDNVQGFASSTLGADVDGDGFDDVLVLAGGAQGRPELLVYSGSARGLSQRPSARIATTPDEAANRCGPATALASSGDVNGDGYADVIARSYGGCALVYLGGARGLSASDAIVGSPWVTGAIVADVDGDGFADAVLESQRGIELYRGSPSGVSSKGTTIVNTTPEGTLLFSPGDVNGDGRADLVFQARRDTTARLILGAANGDKASPMELTPAPSFLWQQQSAPRESAQPAREPPTSGAVQIAAGMGHTCACMTDHTVRCWGLVGRTLASAALQPKQVPGVDRATSLTAGAEHTCARIADGTAQCWGARDGKPAAVPYLEGALSLDRMGQYPCALRRGGTLECLLETGIEPLLEGVAQFSGTGENGCAVVGAGRVKCWKKDGRGRKTEQIALPIPATKVATPHFADPKEEHACAVLTDGTAWCWGKDSPRPVQVAPLRGVEQIATYESSTCALTRDGRVWCWGRSSNKPTLVAGLQEATKLASDVPCLVSRAGQVQCWKGDQLPAVVPGLAGVAGIASGFIDCAWRQDGTVACWNDGDASARPAKEVPGLTDVVDVAIGATDACARMRDGSVRCWGMFLDTEPMTVSGLTDTATLADGEQHSCALLDDGSIRCWGAGAHGELGNGDYERSVQPQRVLSRGAASRIAAGDGFSCAIWEGRPSCWGHGVEGSLGDGNPVDKSWPSLVKGASHMVDVVAGGRTACALREDSTVWCWGENEGGMLTLGKPGQITAPIRLAGLDGGIEEIALGAGSWCARSKGAIRCWMAQPDPAGGDAIGRLVDIAGMENVAQLGVGAAHACALARDGAVRCWGDNRVGQLGDGTRVSRTTAASVRW
jgi:alpha-tubulin suppressor-like RCC1 family protein